MTSLCTVLLTGGRGRLGTAVQEAGKGRLDIVAPPHAELDITHYNDWCAWLGKVRPHVILHAAALTDTSNETDSELMWRTNALAPLMMAHAARDAHCPWWHISTDYVFDGESATPYRPVLPKTLAKGTYGQSKAWAEVALWRTLEATKSQLGIIGRLGWLMVGEHDFVDAILTQGKNQIPFQVVENQWGTPSFVEPVAEWMVSVLEAIHQHQEAHGTWQWCLSAPYQPIWHMVLEGGALSRLAWAQRLLEDADMRTPVSGCPLPAYPPRPQSCRLMPSTPGHPALPAWQRAQRKVVARWKAQHP